MSINTYPINVAPINGNATIYGVGVAALSGSGLGRAATVRNGLVTEADMAMDVPPPWAVRRRPGTAVAQMDGWAQALGILGQPGVSDALMLFDMEGEGQSFGVVGSSATLVMSIPLSRGGVMARGTIGADMEMRADVHGIAAHGVHASARAHLTLETTGRAWLAQTVKGGAYALGWTYAKAGATLTQYAGSLAKIETRTRAFGRVATRIYGTADAALRMDSPQATARTYRGVRGAARATLTMAVTLRDQRIVVLPSEFSDAPRSRQMKQARDNRSMRVPRDRRNMKVGQ